MAVKPELGSHLVDIRRSAFGDPCVFQRQNVSLEVLQRPVGPLCDAVGRWLGRSNLLCPEREQAQGETRQNRI